MTQWVSNAADKSNAFILSDAGYDVWMGNNRGSTYSRGHVKYDRKDFQFWQFYQEEMGTVDVTTFVDFIIEKTGVEKVSYVGHSEGTTQMFMALSLMPDYFRAKVNVFVAMAPPVFIRSITDPTTLKEASHWRLIQDLVERLKLYNLFKVETQYQAGLLELCDLAPSVCRMIEHKSEFLIPAVDNMERGKVMLANFPSGSGYRCFIFYGQCVASGGLFRRFDYGKDSNMAIYGQTEPPEYPVDDIDMPIAIFNGSLDPVVLEADVDYLIERLGDKVVYHKVIEADHWTFSMARDMSWFENDLV